MSPKALAARVAKFVPNGEPRWVRCYDNGGASADRYTVCFTGRYTHLTGGEHIGLGMNAHPFHPQGIGMHFGYRFQCDTLDKSGRPGNWPPAMGRSNHLGKRVPFASLPDEVKRCVMQTYNDLWNLE